MSHIYPYYIPTISHIINDMKYSSNKFILYTVYSKEN